MDTSKAGDRLLARVLAGDRQALAEAFTAYRERLQRMVALRMDARVQRRLDASDVVQQAYVDAAQQLPNYMKDPKLPFYLWLRIITGQRMAKLHRQHLAAAKQNVAREISLDCGRLPAASSFHLAAHLIGNFTSPSQHAVRDELRARVQQVLDEMAADDREILALRHFEQMTIRESASVLGITETAASSRYRRALLKIKRAFEQVPGLLDGYAGSAEQRVDDK